MSAAHAACWALVLLFAGGFGCAGASRAPKGDPELKSRSEFDLANDLWRRQNRPREALDHALEATRIDGKNADAAHLTALLYLYFCAAGPNECRLAEAERFARQAVRARKDFREAQNTLGVILIHEKRYDEAIAVLEPLSRDMLYTTPENAWGNLGWAHLEKGDVDNAIEALRRSVAAQPMFCVGRYRLGLAYERKGQNEAAAEALGEALATEADGCEKLQDAWAARGRVFARLGRGDAARADFERCVALDAENKTGAECRSMLDKLE
jgi:Tfp pilus assembly protein PilF